MNDSTNGAPNRPRAEEEKGDLKISGVSAKAEVGNFGQSVLPAVNGVAADIRPSTAASEPLTATVEALETNDSVDAVVINSGELLKKLDEAELWLRGQHVLILHAIKEIHGRPGHNSEQGLEIPDVDLGFKAFAAARAELLSGKPKQEVLELAFSVLQKIWDQIISVVSHPLIATAIGTALGNLATTPLHDALKTLATYIAQNF